jgi:hypothetical protein
MDFIDTVYVDTTQAMMQGRIKNYFERQGYRTKSRDGVVYYERGSAWRNYVAMNPANWHVFARTEMHKTDDEKVAVNLWLSVDTQGQMVLDREHLYWKMAFDTLLTYLKTGVDDHEAKIHEIGETNKRQNYTLTLAVVLIAGVAGLVALLLILGSSCPCPR